MKNVLLTRKLIKAAAALVILVYFAIKTPGHKLLFAPFLLCCGASIGKNLSLLLNADKVAVVFDKLFKVVFFLSWFGFLVVACYVAVKDGNYKVILFTLPFWAGGLFFAKRKLFPGKDQNTEADGEGV